MNSRILVVDDNEANRDMLSRRLARHGHGVAMAAGGAEALERLGAEPFDLVLLDIMMPEMNGYEVLERLKADPELQHIPVIMITAINEMESVVRCIEMGAEDHLPKPFNATLLKARVESSLAKKRLHDREQLVARAMARELEIGRNIQAGFLPPELPAIAGWEIGARFRPARQVAGDFYDAFPLTDDGRTAFVVSDVCDKGVGAALFMAVFRSLLRVLLRESYAARPDRSDAEHIPHAIRVLSDYNALTHASANMFATVFFGVLDPASGVLTYVNAGHDAPAVLRQGRVLRRLEPTGPAAGLLPGLQFAAAEVTLAAGDTLLAFTDGVTDARSPSGAAWGEDQLFAAALAAGAEPVASMLNALDAGLLAHTSGAEPFDDITLLAVRRR
jgi:serine phosphatase RsbU (regulator of sigma subunit)